MLEEANKAAKDAPKEPVLDENADINFTEKAVEKIIEIRDKEATPEVYFRVGIQPGGCSGMSYLMMFEEKKNDDDVELEKFGLKIIVDRHSLAMLNGANIDFVETLQESGFKIDNPNASKGCGCGKSFA